MHIVFGFKYTTKYRYSQLYLCIWLYLLHDCTYYVMVDQICRFLV